MNKSKTIWIWLFVSFLVIGIGGYFLFKYFHKETSVDLQNQSKEGLSREEKLLMLQNLSQNSSTTISISQKNKIISKLQKESTSTTLSDLEKMNILKSLQAK